MKWSKLGQVFQTSESSFTHAMHPVVEVLDAGEGLIRIYYTHRDQSNNGFLSYLDARVQAAGFSILYNHDQPLFEHGELGNFDDSGVCVTSMVKLGDVRRFYYYGWNLGVTVPFRNAIGVAEATGDGPTMRLDRLFPGPILDRAPRFPGLCATPCVIKEDGLFRMYFGQGTPWLIKDGKPSVACNIGYAESIDGLVWVRSDVPAVANLHEHIVTTPCVKKDGSLYRMWYSLRGEKYRIGYAESHDGKVYTRKDSEVGITVSQTGWDSEMVCYPSVFDVQDGRYMIYCGNVYGKLGFGLAVLDNTSP